MYYSVYKIGGYGYDYMEHCTVRCLSCNDTNNVKTVHFQRKVLDTWETMYMFDCCENCRKKLKESIEL